jgi:hypothetical protein
MIEPIHQDPADLVLTILAGELETQLTILEKSALDMDDWRLTFHIIGESHLVTVEHEGVTVLCELLACVDATAESCVHRHSFGDLTEHCFAQSGYSIRVNFGEQPEALTMNEDHEKLEVIFPDIDGQTPVTRIEWTRVGENAVSWRTLHLYPRDGKMTSVHSFSHFDTLHYNRPS